MEEAIIMDFGWCWHSCNFNSLWVPLAEHQESTTLLAAHCNSDWHLLSKIREWPYLHDANTSCSVVASLVHRPKIANGLGTMDVQTMGGTCVKEERTCGRINGQGGPLSHETWWKWPLVVTWLTHVVGNVLDLFLFLAFFWTISEPPPTPTKGMDTLKTTHCGMGMHWKGYLNGLFLPLGQITFDQFCYQK